MVNGAYILSVLSDPFGWGWNLFGTAEVPWTPILPHWIPYIQIALLAGGAYFAISSLVRIGKKMFSSRSKLIRSMIPQAIFIGIIVVSFLKLFAG